LNFLNEFQELFDQGSMHQVMTILHYMQRVL